MIYQVGAGLQLANHVYLGFKHDGGLQTKSKLSFRRNDKGTQITNADRRVHFPMPTRQRHIHALAAAVLFG